MSHNHWMMFGTFAEQRYFVYPSMDTYKGVIINANMAAYAPEGISSFILEKTANQTYLIDPQTHAFQHDPVSVQNAEGEIKKSIGQLAEAYGDWVVELAGKSPLLPEMLDDAGRHSELVNRCLEFQKTRVSERMENSENLKYMDEPTSLEPYALVAPYFYMQEATIHRWLPKNVRSVELALTAQTERPIFGSIVISQGLLSDEHIKRIHEAFEGIELDGFLIWVDKLDEGTAGKKELEGLLELARGLKLGPHGKDREIINLHGGYFSVLATGNALDDPVFTGVSHGPEFGEYRPIVPVGGGIPIARYYVPALHLRVRYREAVEMLKKKGYLESREKFLEHVCDCAECRTTKDFTLFGVSKAKLVKRGAGLARMEYPTSETKLRCLQHYLQRKAIEYKYVLTASREQILRDLATGRTEYEDRIGLDGVAHLQMWQDVLSEYA